MASNETIERVSVHGGHSGEFCNHATDTLEAVIRAYLDKGFSWVGITDHMPPTSDKTLYPDEKAAGWTADALTERFDRYFKSLRRLQADYADRITIYAAFETEFYTGSAELTERLIEAYRPDYVVGSLHHVNDIVIDGSAAEYRRAAESVGGVTELYCAYFDAQHDLIRTLRPAVVGHFDLIRIFDPDYAERMEAPEIWQRILRNLAAVRDLDLILDFNLRALKKGAKEPYISRPILEKARDMGIAVVPGDDSHGVADVGLNWEVGLKIIRDVGLPTEWKRPVPY